MASELLSPAEAALLLEPSGSTGTKCLQAGLLALAGRGHVEIGQSGGIFSQSTLQVRPGSADALPDHLVALKRALNSSGGARPLKASEVIRALQKAFGTGYRRYVHDHVAPSLIARGLIRREDRKFLGLIPYVHYDRTLAGSSRTRRLGEVMDELGGMKQLLRDDPDRARQLAATAGVLLVLSPEAKAQLPKIKALLNRDSGGSSHILYADDGSDGASLQLGVDLGNFSISTDVCSMIDDIGSVGDFTGGDGGGDGGDGGGGGD